MGSLISIIIPTYNNAFYLDECLNSVLSQTYENWECIIIDNGSTDNTQEIINHWINKDKRFQYHFYNEQKGASYARNFGIDRALGDYIAFLDSDDIWLPFHLEHLSKYITEHNVDLCFSQKFYFKNNEYLNYTDDNTTNSLGSILKGTEGIKTLLQHNEISTPNVLVKKEHLIEIGKFNFHKNAEDLFAWLSLLINNKTFYKSNKITTGIRTNDKSTSAEDRICTRELVEIIHLFKDEIKNRGGGKL